MRGPRLTREKPVQSQPDPFDFSEYSSSQDGTDPPPPDPNGPVWGSSPTFGGGFDTSSDPFGPSTMSATAAPDTFVSQQGAFTQGKTPAGWVAGAFMAALVGLVLALVALLGGSVVLAWVGWGLAVFLAAPLLAAHMSADTKERARPVYQPSKLSHTVYWVALVLAAAAIVLSAWEIAEWMGRR
ncbi:hypothetical protein ACFWCF_12485 [Rhodococcus sp. NPDC060090]|uniref:hypothetical protein n=1 Tax=Rhodococcus sp. NPDC060090 TaxID=3347056 RepID=UPI00364B7D45